ncbi:hypothetical protein D3OALGA1CA_2889 [Olavius algarvensis associated proteobacterium Delta 3]|nr:hypothetical protein D3OALGB2SA_2723 [Olavius algarvensis associated proteobacterium Delta 3]CAB5125847.1 hypothetical protein D3OALGA1CA_2889 [Olavius algarvensis associated proteobacterium Delta 3]
MAGKSGFLTFSDVELFDGDLNPFIRLIAAALCAFHNLMKLRALILVVNTTYLSKIGYKHPRPLDATSCEMA